jgi:hypothetical protein
MRGTTIGGKAEAGATAILGVSAFGVKRFFFLQQNKSVNSGNSLEVCLILKRFQPCQPKNWPKVAVSLSMFPVEQASACLILIYVATKQFKRKQAEACST